MSDSAAEFWGSVLLLLLLIPLYCLGAALTGVHQDEAMASFYEQTRAQQIVVRAQSSQFPLGGQPWDVQYELKVDGRLMGARCTSGMLSPTICRVYANGGD